MKIIEIENRPTYIFGDFHGEMENIIQWYFKTKGIENCNIIVAGDCGIGFKTESKENVWANKINDYLIEHNITCYFIRGNHDDPSYFTNHKIDKSNLIFLEDYTLLKYASHYILCVGGALSIDRSVRMRNYYKRLSYLQNANTVSLDELKKKYPPYYWEDEIPIYNEEMLNEFIQNNILIEYVITHTSPSFAFKNDTKGIEYWLRIDEDLEKDLVAERKVLSQIYNFLTTNQPNVLKWWTYGHFHEHHEEVINNIEFTALLNADYDYDVKMINFV